MIFWELILKTEDVGQRLQELYESFEGVNALARHLGVSRVSLLKKLKECGIERKARGGAHFRIERESLPDKWWTMDVDALTSMTGYSANYVRKLRRDKRCALADSTKTKTATSTE